MSGVNKEITKEEYNKARSLVLDYDKQEALKRKNAFIEKYKGKTKEDIVTREYTIGRFKDKCYALFVVDMDDDLAIIREHEGVKDPWWTIQGGRRTYKTYDGAFSECAKRLKRKGYIV